MRARGMPVPDSTQPGAGGAGSPKTAVQDAKISIWEGVYTEAQAVDVARLLLRENTRRIFNV